MYQVTELKAKKPINNYKELKRRYPDNILLLRYGDFYYSFMKDAEEVASVLRIALSRSGNLNSGFTVFTHFPVKALDTYLPKLVRAGKRIGIYDQNK